MGPSKSLSHKKVHGPPIYREVALSDYVAKFLSALDLTIIVLLIIINCNNYDLICCLKTRILVLKPNKAPSGIKVNISFVLFCGGDNVQSI